VPNLNEFFVHHEDVRRANGGTRRALDPIMNDALWANARGWAWYLARRLNGPGLDIRNSVTGQTARARRGAPAVWIVGEPGELLLYLFGRQNVAEVDFAGPVDAIEAVTRAKFGL
jgi:uncharacterized protein (TIGR03085 family)